MFASRNFRVRAARYREMAESENSASLPPAHLIRTAQMLEEAAELRAAWDKLSKFLVDECSAAVFENPKNNRIPPSAIDGVLMMLERHLKQKPANPDKDDAPNTRLNKELRKIVIEAIPEGDFREHRYSILVRRDPDNREAVYFRAGSLELAVGEELPILSADLAGAIRAEIKYQDEKFGADKGQSLIGYLTVVENEISEAKHGWTKNLKGRHSPLHELLQAVTVGIRCLNRYGTSGCTISADDEVPARPEDSPSEPTQPESQTKTMNYGFVVSSADGRTKTVLASGGVATHDRRSSSAHSDEECSWIADAREGMITPDKIASRDIYSEMIEHMMKHMVLAPGERRTYVNPVIAMPYRGDNPEPMSHDLKCDVEPFEALRSGRKKVEIRWNDRNFLTGDSLLIREYRDFKPTGRKLGFFITHVQAGYGMPPGLVALSIRMTAKDSRRSDS